MDGRVIAQRMIAALELNPARVQIGTTKVFFKAGAPAELEECRDEVLYDVFARCQAAARGWTAPMQMRKILARAVAIGTIQRNARLCSALREWPWRNMYTKVRIRVQPESFLISFKGQSSAEGRRCGPSSKPRYC